MHLYQFVVLPIYALERQSEEHRRERKAKPLILFYIILYYFVLFYIILFIIYIYYNNNKMKTYLFSGVRIMYYSTKEKTASFIAVLFV